jgi:hypothetical protein
MPPRPVTGIAIDDTTNSFWMTLLHIPHSGHNNSGTARLKRACGGSFNEIAAYSKHFSATEFQNSVIRSVMWYI